MPGAKAWAKALPAAPIPGSDKDEEKEGSGLSSSDRTGDPELGGGHSNGSSVCYTDKQRKGFGNDWKVGAHAL